MFHSLGTLRIENGFLIDTLTNQFQVDGPSATNIHFVWRAQIISNDYREMVVKNEPPKEGHLAPPETVIYRRE